MIYLQAPADPVWEGHVASTLSCVTCMGTAIGIKWKWDNGHLNAQILSECGPFRDVNAIKWIILQHHSQAEVQQIFVSHGSPPPLSKSLKYTLCTESAATSMLFSSF